MLGRDVSVPTRFKCRRARVGSAYGGWWVRTDVLGPSSTVYSAGIGQDISFDLGLIQRYGRGVHAFDPTRKCRDWVGSPQLPTKFVFTAVGLADYDGSGTFVLRSRPDWDDYELNVPSTGAFDSEELPVARVAMLTRRFSHQHLDILKLDIEGAENDVIKDVLSADLDVRQILVEFHYRRGTSRLTRLHATLDALERAGYVLFARSPVGPEFSFWRS